MRYGRRVSALVFFLFLALVIAHGGARTHLAAQTAEREALKKQLKSTFDREMARRDPGVCPDARTTYDINMCVANDLSATEENYKQYAATVRTLLTSMVDPEPLLVSKFDESQKAWATYREALCGLTYDWFAGGTAAASMAVSCHLTVTRSHMSDLHASIGANLMR